MVVGGERGAERGREGQRGAERGREGQRGADGSKTREGRGNTCLPLPLHDRGREWGFGASTRPLCPIANSDASCDMIQECVQHATTGHTLGVHLITYASCDMTQECVKRDTRVCTALITQMHYVT